MKNFIIIILVAIVILIASVLNQDEVITESISYDINEIEKINVNLDYADINIASAEVDQIQVEATYSENSEHQEHYFSYVEDKTLYIDNYIVNEGGVIDTDATINIYVPVESKIKEINVDINTGSVLVSGIDVPVINIYSNEADVNIAESSIKSLRIETNFAKVTIRNTIADNIDIVGEKANVLLDHVTSKIININSEVKMIVDYVYCVTNEFNITGNDVELTMTLYDNTNYNITSNTKINNMYFIGVDGVYEYKAEVPVDTANFNFKNVDVKNILMVQK